MNHWHVVLVGCFVAAGFAILAVACWIGQIERDADRAADELIQMENRFLEHRRGATRENLLQFPAVAAPFFFDTFEPADNEGGAEGGHTLNGKATALSSDRTSCAAPVRKQMDRGGNSHQRRVRRRALARAGIITALLSFCVSWASGQVLGTATLTWTASVSECESNCAKGTGPTLVNVYRAMLPASGTCVGAGWVQVATGAPASGPYSDPLTSYGVWCYMVRAYFANNPKVESVNSNLTAVNLIDPSPVPGQPSALKATTP